MIRHSEILKKCMRTIYYHTHDDIILHIVNMYTNMAIYIYYDLWTSLRYYNAQQ